jgi:Reeler domain
MKRTTFTSIVLAAILAVSIFNYQTAKSNSGGALAGYSSAGGTNCSSCHGSSGPYPTLGLISSTIPAGGYTPGTIYSVTAAYGNSTGTSYGFEVSAKKASGTAIPSAFAVPAGNNTVQLKGTNDITHTNIGHTWASHTASWTFDWTAPAAGSGAVTFYGAFIIGNGGGSSGDSTLLSTLTVQELVAAAASDSIAITSGSNPSCNGDTLTFTVYPTNGGATPSYQWQVNGANVGSNSTTYMTSTLSTGDMVTCIMTPSGGGAAVTSNMIMMTVNIPVMPTITAQGDTLTSSLAATYQWYMNAGISIPSATSQTYVATVTGTYRVVTTDANGCKSTSPPQSVNAPLATTVISLVKGTNPACAGDTLTFVANITNGGATPFYQWQINGATVGTNSDTFRSSTITNGQSVLCHMTPTGGFITTSNVIAMTINALPTIPVITSTGNILTSSALTGNQWYLNGIAQADTTRRDTAVVSGSYTVRAKNAAGCVSKPSQPRVITISLSVALSTGTNPSCAGDNLSFTATPLFGGTNPTYQWLLNGSPVGTNSVTYSGSTFAVGDTVSCTMTPQGGVAVQANKIGLTVNPLPATPTFTINVNVLTSSAATGNQWYLNGNVIAGATQQTYTAITTGAYSLVVTNANGCKATSIAQTITVSNTLVNITLTAGGNPACAGDVLTFTATPVNGGATPVYQWRVNSIVQSSVAATLTTTSLLNGDTVTCIMTPSGGGAAVTSNAIVVTVNSLPAVPTVTLSGNVLTASAAPTYQWYLNGTSINNATTQTDTASLSGSYTVQVKDANGCKSTSLPVVINLNITVQIAITSGSNPGCIGKAVTFTATPINGGASPSYVWKVNGVNVSTGAPTYTSSTLTNGAQVGCTMTPAGGSPVTSNTITMNLLAAPAIPTLSLNGRTLTSSTATTYQWYLSGVLIPGATLQSFTVTQSGLYTVEIGNAAGCTKLSIPLNVNISGVDEVNSTAHFMLYPSPNIGSFTVESPVIEGAELMVIDMTGRVLYNTQVTSTRQVINIGHVEPQLCIAIMKHNGQSSQRLFEVY